MAADSEFQKKSQLKIIVPEALNYEKRLLGFPVADFFLLLLPGLILSNKNLIYGAAYFVFLWFLGRVRAKKPNDWFRYLPYMWFKIHYPYLIKPGKRTYLP